MAKIKTILMHDTLIGYSFQDAFVEIDTFGCVELISCGQLTARVYLTPNGARVPIVYELHGSDLERADKKEHTISFLNQFGWRCDNWAQAVRLFGYKKED